MTTSSLRLPIPRLYPPTAAILGGDLAEEFGEQVLDPLAIDPR